MRRIFWGVSVVCVTCTGMVLGFLLSKPSLESSGETSSTTHERTPASPEELPSLPDLSDRRDDRGSTVVPALQGDVRPFTEADWEILDACEGGLDVASIQPTHDEDLAGRQNDSDEIVRTYGFNSASDAEWEIAQALELDERAVTVLGRTDERGREQMRIVFALD